LEGTRRPSRHDTGWRQDAARRSIHGHRPDPIKSQHFAGGAGREVGNNSLLAAAYAKIGINVELSFARIGSSRC